MKRLVIPAGTLAGIFIIWETVYRLGLFPQLLFPSAADIGYALITGFSENRMGDSVAYTLSLIGKGLAVGIALAFAFSALTAVYKKSFGRIYNTIIAVFDPLPGIAMLPLAILWFGTGEATIIFIIVHSVIWPFSRNLIDGFRATPRNYVEFGENIGLKGFGLAAGVYLPAAFSYMLSGLKVGWARAWRAVISAEMIFGVSGSVGGLGWYIFTRRYMMDTAGVFASLVLILAVGLIIEYIVFEEIEKHTIRKWGMVR